MKSRIHWTLESKLHTSDQDSSVLGQKLLKTSYVGVDTEKANMQDFQKFDKIIVPFFFFLSYFAHS